MIRTVLIMMLCWFVSFAQANETDLDALQDELQQIKIQTEIELLQLDIEQVRADMLVKEQLNRDALEALSFQDFQTKAISLVVLGMVLFGLWLSYLQFKRDEPGKESNNELKIGSAGISISSKVIGLIILVISFWFFSVYVDKVYQVNTKHISLGESAEQPK